MTEPDRDDKVTRAYRALGGEEPPRTLDDAILAASRRPQHRWRVPLSIAAVLVLAVGVTLRMLPPSPDAESVALAPQVIQAAKPAPAAAESAAKFAQDVPGAAAPRAEAPSSAGRSVAGARVEPAKRSPQVSTGPAAMQSAKRAEASAPAALERSRPGDELAASAATQSVQSAPAPAAAASVAGTVQRDAGVAAEGRARALVAAPPAPAAAVAAKLPEPTLAPEAWLKRIAELRKEGREREAQESLAEFRKRYPDYKIPETLLR